MKIITILAIVLLCCISLLALSACKSGSTAVPQSQTVTVQQGNLTVAITASGNLSLSHVQNLAFQMSGTVTDVLVQLGDSVTQGQVLAKLDTTAWNSQVTTLQDQLTAKQHSLGTAQHQLEAKQNALNSAQHQFLVKQDAAMQAQNNLQTANYNLYVISDVATANNQLTQAQQQLLNDQKSYEAAVQSLGGDIHFWATQLSQDKANITTYQQNLSDVLTGHSTTLTPDVADQIALKQNAVQIAQNSVIEAQNSIEDAQNAINDAHNAVEDSQMAVDDAQNAVNESQTTLNQTKAQSPTITAPFDGFISQVNVAQGDQIYNGKVAVQLSDPTQFEVDVLVSERDIFNVNSNSTATVQMDALPGVTLPGKVSKISHTASIQSGVVNYTVGVQITSLQAISSSGRTSGTPRATSSPVAGSTTRAASPRPSATATPNPAPSATPAPTATSQPVTVQPKAGLTATASIIVAQRSNVLLVPTLAIISEQNGNYVQVLKNGVITQDQVQVGISNFQSAEIISGLNVGDTVVIPQTTPGATNNRGPSFFQGGGGFRIGG